MGYHLNKKIRSQYKKASDWYISRASTSMNPSNGIQRDEFIKQFLMENVND